MLELNSNETREAILTFYTNDSAKEFTRAWSLNTLTGHSMSAVKPDGSVIVTVYNVDDAKKAFIENYVKVH